MWNDKNVLGEISKNVLIKSWYECWIYLFVVVEICFCVNENI